MPKLIIQHGVQLGDGHDGRSEYDLTSVDDLERLREYLDTLRSFYDLTSVKAVSFVPDGSDE